MKEKLVARIQSLGRQANQLRQVVEAAPAQAARLRESVLLSVGQLNQLRSEIQSGISELRSDSGDHLLKVLGEVRDSTSVIRQTGFELAGVDLEIGLTAGQRLLLLLRKMEDVPATAIRALVDAHAARPALRGVLASIQRAVELADTVDLPGLSLGQLIIAVGPIPTIRIGWRGESPVPLPVSALSLDAESPPVLSQPSAMRIATSEVHSTLVVPESVLTSPTPPAPVSAVRAPIPAPSVQPLPPTQAPAPTPPVSTTAKVLGAHWRTNALDRFKKMPDLHKAP
jgi:hypothetical protein